MATPLTQPIRCLKLRGADSAKMAMAASRIVEGIEVISDSIRHFQHRGPHMHGRVLSDD